MTRLNALLISCLVALAGVSGIFAAIQVLDGGPASASAFSPSDVSRRTTKLDRWERSLRKNLAKKPPALPPVPVYAPVTIPSAAPATVAATSSRAQRGSAPKQQVGAVGTPASNPQEQVIYVQPDPIVQYVQQSPQTTSAHGEDEEHEDEEHEDEEREHETEDEDHHAEQGGSAGEHGSPSQQEHEETDD